MSFFFEIVQISEIPCIIFILQGLVEMSRENETLKSTRRILIKKESEAKLLRKKYDKENMVVL